MKATLDYNDREHTAEITLADGKVLVVHNCTRNHAHELLRDCAAPAIRTAAAVAVDPSIPKSWGGSRHA